MNRYMILFFSFFVLCGVFNFAVAQEIEPEKEAVTRWVMDNAQVDLPASKAAAIVRHAYLYAFHNELDPLLVLSVMRTESGFKERAASSGGARGLMQVIPYWHRDKLKGRSPFNPQVSIEVGSRVLGDCAKKHSSTLRVLSCYSGGGGKRYYRKVMAQRSSLQRTIYSAQQSEREIIYAQNSY